MYSSPPAQDRPAVIEIRDLTKWLDGRFVLDRVTTTVGAGGIVSTVSRGWVGHNPGPLSCSGHKRAAECRGLPRTDRRTMYLSRYSRSGTPSGKAFILASLLLRACVG